MPGAITEPQKAMSSILSKTQTESTGGATGFSYAQAAKGRAVSTAPSATPSNQESGATTPAKATPSELSSSEAPNGDVEKKPVTAEAVTREIETGVLESAKSSINTTSSEPSSDATLAPAAPSPKEEGSAPLPPHLADSDWRSARPKASHEHHNEAPERRKKGKSKKARAAEQEAVEKEKEKEKEKEEIKPEVFVEAAAPSVNIWQQRSQAQAAKVKPIAPTTPNPAAGLASNGTEATSKSIESKKKGRSTNGEEVTEASTSKVAKKTFDAAVKKEEGRRLAPRGSRAEEKVALPPVADAVSWPTPETAVEEEKRKLHEKMDKDEVEDTSSSKPRAKKEWVTVPFTPSVQFNTPLPSRGAGRAGGRGGRGGRESTGRGGQVTEGSLNGDKPYNEGVNIVSDVRERARDSSTSNRGPSRAASLPPKKSASDSAANGREQHKPSVPSGAEKTKADLSASASSFDLKKPESRRQSVTQHDKLATSSTENLESAAPYSDKELTASFEQQVHGQNTKKLSNYERKHDAAAAGDRFLANGQGQPREGGRGGRGRGGYRGAHGLVNGQQTFTNGHGQQTTNGYPARQGSVTYSPPQQPQQYVGSFVQNGQRGRGGGPARTLSIPNGQAMYGRYSQNVPMHHIGPQGFEYPGQAFVDWSNLPMVIMQAEYYFSVDNLCKDVYLRKQMDSQGFVNLAIISQFKRIQSMTPEIEVLRVACQEASSLEIVTGDDGVDRVRRLDQWEQWILPMEERDDSAKNPGPQKFFPLQPYQSRGHQAMSPQGFSPNGLEPNFHPFMVKAPVPMTNGVHRGEFGQHTESPLSAIVPDFTPGLPIAQSSDYSEIQTTFSNAEIPSLVVAYNQKSASGQKARTPFHTAGSRTFSNGSILPADIPQDLSELEKSPEGAANGTQTTESSPESLRQSRASLAAFGEISPTKALFSHSPPVMWLKDQTEHGSLSSHAKQEFYTVLHQRFLHERHDYDSKVFYEFLSHFLVRNFNPGMYEEFRTLAVLDAQQRQQMCGMENLITFYDQALNSTRGTIPEIFAKHYVEAIRTEAESLPQRPGLAKLRSSWKSRSLDILSREKIAMFLDDKLREELES